MSNATDSLVMRMYEVGSAKPSFRKAVMDKLNDWFGGDEKYTRQMSWYDNGTAYVTVSTLRNNEFGEFTTTLYFFRLFEIGGKMELSQDRKVEIETEV